MSIISRHRADPYLLIHRFPQVSGSRIFAQKTMVYTLSLLIWDWEIRKRYSTLRFLEKTQVFSIRSQRTYYHLLRNFHLHMPLSTYFSRRTNYWPTILKTLTISKQGLVLARRNWSNVTAPLLRPLVLSADIRFLEKKSSKISELAKLLDVDAAWKPF